MTERQALIAHKQTVLRTKARLKQMQGVEVIELFEENEPDALRELYSAYLAYSAAYSYCLEPCSRLPHGSSESEICSWLMSEMRLREGYEYFFHYNLWVQLRIQHLYPAVQSLWSGNGFLLAETDFSRILEAGFDSRDEDHYLIDIWKPEQGTKWS